MRVDQSTVGLLSGCRAGDAQAWEKILDRYERLVFAIATREGLSREDAADVTQLTFEALLNQLDKIRDDDQIASWLMTVARRQAWKTRDRANRCTVAELWELEQVYDPVADHSNVLWLYEGLSKLGQECRVLLTLLYFDPAAPSYTQVAAQLGRSVGAIGPTRARCLRRLRKILAGEGEGGG